MAIKIAILEDNADRQARMRGCLADRFRTFEVHVFDTSSAMIGFLTENLSETIAIALDHDLEMIAVTDGQLIDPGTGREVADFLATQRPVCPVVIHTTNSVAAVGMIEVLREAGWKTKRVVPFDDLNWIATDWFFAIRRSVVGPINKTKKKAKA